MDDTTKNAKQAPHFEITGLELLNINDHDDKIDKKHNNGNNRLQKEPRQVSEHAEDDDESSHDDGNGNKNGYLKNLYGYENTATSNNNNAGRLGGGAVRRMSLESIDSSVADSYACDSVCVAAKRKSSQKNNDSSFSSRPPLRQSSTKSSNSNDLSLASSYANDSVAVRRTSYLKGGGNSNRNGSDLLGDDDVDDDYDDYYYDYDNTEVSLLATDDIYDPNHGGLPQTSHRRARSLDDSFTRITSNNILSSYYYDDEEEDDVNVDAYHNHPFATSLRNSSKKCDLTYRDSFGHNNNNNTGNSIRERVRC